MKQPQRPSVIHKQTGHHEMQPYRARRRTRKRLRRQFPLQVLAALQNAFHRNYAVILSEPATGG